MQKQTAVPVISSVRRSFRLKYQFSASRNRSTMVALAMER